VTEIARTSEQGAKHLAEAASAARLEISELEAEAKSRMAGLRIAMLTLRMLENWRNYLSADPESAMIVLATAAITMEKFTRLGFDEDLRNIRTAMPPEQLTKCNISSIAAAIGSNRETVRRKVNRLLDRGVLLRDDEGSLRLCPEYTLSVPTSAMLRSQLEVLAQTGNGLLREGILQLVSVTGRRDWGLASSDDRAD
jgi:Holliday junction resolvasome RuvABC ATP-dependent DNA helicase subunit